MQHILMLLAACLAAVSQSALCAPLPSSESCRGRCEAPQVGPASTYECYCDPGCVDFGDCCTDACLVCGVDCIVPTDAPTQPPTRRPVSPTPTPRPRPTLRPTSAPTRQPTRTPTKSPTALPTAPTVTYSPTKSPTRHPSPSPTKSPTKSPTRRPTPSPSKSPTALPTFPVETTSPTKTPTRRPTPKPSRKPAPRPTSPTRNPQQVNACLRDERPSEILVKLAASARLANAVTPRGQRPKPTFSDPADSCPVPGKKPPPAQIGPAQTGDDDEAVFRLGHGDADSGTQVSWGRVPFWYKGKYYDTPSSLCVTPPAEPYPLALACPAHPWRRCRRVVTVPLGDLSAANMIVMPPYLQAVTLEVSLTVDTRNDAIEATHVLPFELTVLETPNVAKRNPGGRCPGASDSKGRCHDRVGVSPDQQHVVTFPNGVDHKIELKFEGTAAEGEDGEGFWTKENAVTAVSASLVITPMC